MSISMGFLVVATIAGFTIQVDNRREDRHQASCIRDGVIGAVETVTEPIDPEELIGLTPEEQIDYFNERSAESRERLTEYLQRLGDC
jgi:hypothetical protein